MTDGTDDGRLFEWYRAYIGEPDREVDVYLGFALFFAGIGFGIAAFVIGAIGQVTGAGGASADFIYREAAIATGMLALPATLSSVVVLLPVSKRAVYGAAAGSAVSLVGLGGFIWAYPYQWARPPGPTYSVQVLFIYGVGLAALLAATGGALVAYHIDRAKPRPGDFTAEDEETGEEITDEQIQQDIESAMEDVDLTWGGVERTEGSDLKIRPSEGEGDMDIQGMDVEAERVHRSSVDEQVQGLAMVKGGQKTTDRSESTVDDQTNKLAELRKQKREEAKQEDGDETVLSRVLDRIATALGRN
ncbi:permease [Halobacteriales archaeon QS_6_64_34]|nr:MAG: permease [Halobacteriales archaeon QS_6_64_34]